MKLTRIIAKNFGTLPDVDLDQGQIFYNQLLSEWTCRLGDLILIRVTPIEIRDGSSEAMKTSYVFELDIGGQIKKPKGNASSPHEAFQAAFELAQAMLEKSQQDLIKTILKIKEEPRDKTWKILKPINDNWRFLKSKEDKIKSKSPALSEYIKRRQDK
jgi:hypothetical protein